MVVKQAKIIFVNANLRTSRKHFTIAHELGHHYLGHPLQNGAIICDSDSVFGKNKPEQEKEADYFAACFLMPENMVKRKRTEFLIIVQSRRRCSWKISSWNSSINCSDI
ncbi:MAG: ImmA/IrrE family metallo-endopeptidase [Oscillospiraceae bacterium]